MTSDLVAFLRDRLVDVERDADNVHDIVLCDTVPSYGGMRGPCDCGWPELVRADVAARRAILDSYDDHVRWHQDAEADPSRTLMDVARHFEAMEGVRVAVVALAQLFADHHDFDPAWSVSAGVR